MIDTHSHIYCDAFDGDRDEVIARAQQAGVSHIIMPNENLKSLPLLHSTHEQYPQYTSIAIGLHPEEVRDNYNDELEAMCSLLDTGDYIAVGEIGIDLYWDKSYRTQQIEALALQLQWCNCYDLPFIMHCRNGLDEIIEVLDSLERTPRGVFHCWAGDENDVRRLRERGDFYFGVGGVVTFKKSTLPALLPVIGLDRILLETDSPYLAPVPMRGKRNESSYVQHVCNFIASTLGITPQEVAQATTRNAHTLFGI